MHKPVYILGYVVLIMLLSWASFRLAPETSPVSRGAMLSNGQLCFDCHGGIESPVIDANRCAANPLPLSHPRYSLDCGDLLAFFEVIHLRNSVEERGMNTRSNALLAGEQLARKYNCFRCHGYLGQGGFKNTGALKGYVPGYFGSDFKQLTNNGDPNSIRQWITHGLDPSLVNNPITGPIAEYFLQRQAVSMPSFAALPDSEIELLVSYVIALNEFGPMTASDLRAYAMQTSQ